MKPECSPASAHPAPSSAAAEPAADAGRPSEILDALHDALACYERMTTRRRPRPERAGIACELPPPPPLAEGVCPQCRGSGYCRMDVPLGHPQFGRAIPCACKAEELRQRQRKRFLQMSRLTEEMMNMTFETFDAQQQPLAYQQALRFIDVEAPHPFLYLQGVTGSGKTHLAVAIALALLDRGDSLVFMVVPDLMDFLREGFNPGQPRDESYAQRFEDIKNAPWLILDDVGAENPTPWAQEKFYQIVNHRYVHGLPTVLTTNLTLLDMEDRIRSRLSDAAVCVAVPMRKIDYRMTDARAQAPARRKKVTRY